MLIAYFHFKMMLSLTVLDCADIQHYILAVLFINIVCVYCLLCELMAFEQQPPGFTRFNHTIGLPIRKASIHTQLPCTFSMHSCERVIPPLVDI